MYKSGNINEEMVNNFKKVFREYSDLLPEKIICNIKKKISFKSTLPRIYSMKLEVSVKRQIFKDIIDLVWTGKCSETYKYFIASAGCQLDYLKTYDNDELKNSTQEGDTPLQFLLKFGDYDNDNFKECLKLLITEDNINKIDYSGHTPIYSVWKQYNFKRGDIIKILLEEGADPQHISDETYKTMSIKKEVKKTTRTKLFDSAIKNEVQEFKKLKKDSCDYDDGENTLLQLCIIRKQLIMAEYLIKNGANINKTTEKNKYHPLLLLAIFGKQESDKELYNELLTNKRLEVSRELFCEFIKLRLNPVRTEYFDRFLECKKINVDIQAQKNNTPLHYAIIFGNRNAIQGMLKRGASLCKTNDNNKSCLDMIQSSDINDFLDSCVRLDNYSNNVQDIKYKVQLDFKFLLQNNNEIDILCTNKFNKFLTHVLLDIFINLKWKLVENLFIWFSAVRLIHIVLATVILFNSYNYLLIIFLAICQYVITYQFWYNDFLRYDTHSILEIILSLLMTVHLFFYNFAPISSSIYVIMAMSHLLLLGYHPTLSKWSVMLRKVYSSFFKLFLLFIIPIVAFALGFWQIFREKRNAFSNMQYSMFSVLVMLTGEFNASEDFIKDNMTFFNQLFFITFVICMSVVLMNFWTAVTVTDIDKIEKHNERATHQNTIKFIQYVEKNYTKNTIFKTHCPFLFQENRDGKIDIYINRENRAYDHDILRNLKLNAQIKNKLIDHYNKTKQIEEQLSIEHQQSVINELTIKNRNLQEKIINELKKKNHSLQRTIKELQKKN